MKKVSLLTLLTLATLDAFASERGYEDSLESQQSLKKYVSFEQYPKVTIQKILTNQVKTFSRVKKKGLKEFFNNQLHLSKTSVSSGTRYTTNLDNLHVNYIQLLSEKINLDEYNTFIFDPSCVDAGGVKGSLIFPIKCLKEDTEKTLRIFVKFPPKETTPQTTAPQSSLSPRTSPQISLSVPKEQSTTTSSQNKETTKTLPLKNETLLDTITLPPTNTSPRRPSFKTSSSPKTSEELIEELKKVQNQRNK